MKKTNPTSRKRARMTGDRSTRRQALRRLERLESRAMLAADISPWHNAALPGDVDGDGVVSMSDLEILVGEIKATGSRKLGESVSTMGGMEGESPLYLDVTNDGRLGGRDIAQLLNTLRIEGEDHDEEPVSIPAGDDYRAAFDFFIYDAAYDPDNHGAFTPLASDGGNTSLSVGDFFTFVVTVENVSNLPPGLPPQFQGVFAAFIDVEYDSSMVSVVDPNGERLGPAFEPPGVGSGIPNNIVAGDDTGMGEDGLLRAMGGFSSGSAGSENNPAVLFSIQFQVIGGGGGTGFTFTPKLHTFPFPDNPDETYNLFSFERFRTDGTDNGYNLTGTQFLEDGGDPTTDDPFDIIPVSNRGSVSVTISDEAVFGANPDFYQIGQDFDESLEDPDSNRLYPPSVIVNGVEWAVLDVLANDGDEGGNEIPMPRDRFNITGIDTSININLEDAESLEDRLLIVDIYDQESEYAAAIAELGMDFSHQVILYQVPVGLASPPNEVFSYTIEDTQGGNLERDTTFVSILVIPAPAFTLFAGDLDVVGDDALEQGEVFEFNIFDLVTATGDPAEGEELTLDGFIGTAALQGTFIDLEFVEGYGPGWFRYIAPDMALIESFQYQVSFAGLVETGTITIETLSNTRIQGIVFFDVNGDGIWNDNANNNASPEQRIGGVEMQLFQGGVAVGDPIYTNARGEFDFRRIDPGTYSLHITDPRFVIKGLNSDGNFTNIISDIELIEGVSEQALDLSFGYRGRESKYRGFGDFLGSNTEDSIIFAMSKSGGATSMEWYAVDMGWDRLVSIRPDLVFYDAAGGFGQIAFEVTVEGQDEPVLVVHTFSTSSPDFRLIAETSEGLVFRFSGSAADVLTNLAAIDEAYVNY